jgi:tetratricopeptide (TPR) repeat protein
VSKASVRLAAALAAVLLARAAHAAAPWEGEPLEGDPAAIRAAADGLAPPPGVPVDVLFEEGLYRFDARGALVHVHRVLFRPLTPEAARLAGRVDRPWSPWHQARPEIRARVIGEGGSVERLDPASLVEAAATGGTPSERRVVGAPLPGLRAGSIVEQVITVRDTAPLFDAGAVYRFGFGGGSPSRRVRLRIEAPAALPLRFAVRGLDMAPVEAVRDGVRTLVFDRRDLPASPSPEPASPPELPSGPHVAFSVGRSWAEIARAYGDLADARLRGDELRAQLAAAGVDGRRSPEETVARVVAWVRANVRATGVPLSEAPVAPARPADTLSRGAGAAKDVALLVTGLLRAAGLDARLALVATEWHDPPAELPGLGVFDHVLVRVAGKRPIWIEPADRQAAAGRLPVVAQGRLALVAGAGTKELVRTPVSPPAENAAVTVREIHLAELGLGRIVETRELTGALAASEREFRARIPASHRSAFDERYAREVLRGRVFLGAELTGGDDPGAPLRVRLEADECAIVETLDQTASVPVSADAVFDALPPFLGRAEGERVARRQDVVLALPYRSELRYRIVPAEGLRARPLPPDRDERFGAASFSERFVLEPDGAVTASFRFDTGGRRLAASDSDALARRVRDVVRGGGSRVVFERTSAALLAAGQPAEAIAELRRLQALHPREAMHRLHLAVALVQVGAAGAATEEARRAIALEPQRGWGHRVLGWVLEHDAVGRLHGPGFDRAGALAAYRRAAELDPSHAGGRAALAELLGTAPSGLRHGPGADVAAAADAYRALRDETGSRDHDRGLLAALFAAGRHAEAAALAPEVPAAPERNAILVAATAIVSGTARAEEQAATLGEARRDALEGAAALLARHRRHPLASALGFAAARGATNAAELRARAELFAAIRPWEELKDTGDEPTRFVKRLLVTGISSREPRRDLAALVATRVPEGPAREALLAGPALPFDAPHRVGREGGLTPDLLLDLALSQLELVPDGDAATGMRLRVRFRFAPGERGATLYVQKDGGALRLLASGQAWPLLGVEALRLARAGDAAGASRWLAWAREDLPGEPGDPASPAGVLAALARPGVPLDAAAAERAAAALVAVADRSGATLPFLKKARAEAREPAARRALAHALLEAARAAGRADDLLAAADDVLEQDPASREGFVAKALALQRLRRPAELERAAEAILAYRPDDPDVLGTLGSSRLLLGDLGGAARAWRRAIDGGRASPLVYNNAAWIELFRDERSPDALDWARRAVDAGPPGEHGSLNTLAAVHAGLGRVAEAREIFLRSLEGGRVPQGEDWYVFGRIAEALRLEDVARAAYARVEPVLVDGVDDPSGAHHLARRRLAVLDGSRTSPASTRR